MGLALLVGLAAIQAIATPFYDWNRRHLFHPEWPAHARFHVVAYTLLNIGYAVTAAGLALGLPAPLGTRIAAGMLAWAAALQFLACLFPGVTPTADGEKVVKGAPVSLWGSAAYLALAIAGGILAG